MKQVNVKKLITHIGEGFDFLGKNIRKYNGKLLINQAVNFFVAFLVYHDFPAVLSGWGMHFEAGF